MGARARISDPMLAAVCALGITQITAWGTSYYCLGVLAGPIATDTGWSRSLVYFGFTAALLAMGLAILAIGVYPAWMMDLLRDGVTPIAQRLS